MSASLANRVAGGGPSSQEEGRTDAEGQLVASARVRGALNAGWREHEASGAAGNREARRRELGEEDVGDGDLSAARQHCVRGQPVPAVGRARRRDHEQSCWAERRAKRAGGGGLRAWARGRGRLSSPGPAGGDAAGEGRDGSPTELAQRWGQRSHSSRMCRATVFIAVKVSGCRGGGRPMVGLAPESCPGATSQEGADFSREEGASVSHVD